MSLALPPLTHSDQRLLDGYDISELIFRGYSLRQAAAETGLPYSTGRRALAIWNAHQDEAYQRLCDEQADLDLARVAAGEDPHMDIPF